MHWRLVILLLVLSLGCEKESAPPAPVKRKLVLEWNSIVSMRANQRTLLAAGTGGRVFVAQPDAERTASVQAIDSSGDIRATQLSSLRISELLQAPGATPHLRAMVALDDGRIVAFYAGTQRERSLACLVVFDPASESLHLLASPAALAQTSRMGLTLDLAEAQLVLAGDSVWLWLRHSDESVFLRLDARQTTTGAAYLARPFNTLREENETFRPDPSDRIFGQIDGTLHLLRRATGELWRVSREGTAYRVEAPRKHGRMTAPPLIMTRAGETPTRLWFFSDPVQSNDQITATEMEETDVVRHPLLLIQEGAKSTELDRSSMEIRMGFPLHAMRVATWTFDRASDRIVAYDAMSGEVFQLRFVRK